MNSRTDTDMTIQTPPARPRRRRPRTGSVLAGAALAALAVFLPMAAAHAQPLLDLGTAGGVVGDTVSLPVELGGLVDDVWSYELDLRWNQNYATCTGISTAGTLSSGWIVDHLPGSGTVTISGAGAAPLSGDGTLIRVDFELGPSSGSPTVYLDAAVFNEGSPVPDRDNGSLSITPLPALNIYPDSGVMAVGDSLAFNTSGGTAPYTYTSSDPLVAEFRGDNWLYGVGPGFVTVRTEDFPGYTDETTGQVEVRAFDLEAVEVGALENETILIPVRLDDPGPYGITSGEFEATWSPGRLDFVGLETSGTLIEAAGWSDPMFLTGAAGVYVTAAGAAPLSGPGIFVYLRVVAHTSTAVYMTPGIFNEIYPALPDDGYVSVTAPPTLGITPNTENLLVGDLRSFAVTGTYVEPLAWSVDIPALADIDGDGLLQALGEGIVHVRVEDDVGATAESGAINICSLALPALVSSIGADETVSIPVHADRDVAGLGIYSFEMEVTYNPGYVEFLGATTAGSTTMPWGAPYTIDEGGLARVVIAGSEPLAGCGPAFIYLEFRGLPGLSFSYTGVQLQSALFNEGAPCVRINEREPCPYSGIDFPSPAGMRLLPNAPNPFNPSTTIRFVVDTPDPVDLSIYSARGERVRRLFAGAAPAGRMQAVDWNGRDDAGRVAASGVYYCRLQAGDRTLMRKIALLR